MRYVIAGARAATLAVVAERLGVEVRLGSVAETWHGCDAMVLWWPFAYERHGGIPEAGVARVLLNVRDDAPELVLATPPGPGLTTGLDPLEADREAFSRAVLAACVEAFRKEVPDQEDSTVLVHLGAAGLDRGDAAAAAAGIARFLAEEAAAVCVSSFLRHREHIRTALVADYPQLDTVGHVLEAVRAGELKREGESEAGCTYAVHGCGVRMTGSDGAVVELDLLVGGSEAFDMWRLEEYARSVGMSPVPARAELGQECLDLTRKGVLAEPEPGWFSVVE